MFSLGLLVICFTGAIAASTGDVPPSDICSPWDNEIGVFLFDPLKDTIRKNKQEFYKLPELKNYQLPYSSQITLQGGAVGDLTSFDLVHIASDGPAASYMCQDDSTGNQTLAITVGLKDFGFSFDTFQFIPPVLPNVGGGKTSFNIKDNSISVSVTLLTSDTSDACSVQVNYLMVRNLGELTVNFESGSINTVYQYIINHLFSTAVSILNRMGLTDHINYQLQNVANQLAKTNGKIICDILNGF